MTNTNRLGMTNKELGALGEDIAAEWMLSQGFRVIHRNWRYKNGCEIDIVAFKDGELHMVEVKTRTTDFLEPLKAVNMEKLRHISRAAIIYKRIYGHNCGYYIHGIGIVYRGPQDYDLRWMPNLHELFYTVRSKYYYLKN